VTLNCLDNLFRDRLDRDCHAALSPIQVPEKVIDAMAHEESRLARLNSTVFIDYT